MNGIYLLLIAILSNNLMYAAAGSQVSSLVDCLVQINDIYVPGSSVHCALILAERTYGLASTKDSACDFFIGCVFAQDPEIAQLASKQSAVYLTDAKSSERTGEAVQAHVRGHLEQQEVAIDSTKLAAIRSLNVLLKRFLYAAYMPKLQLLTYNAGRSCLQARDARISDGLMLPPIQQDSLYAFPSAPGIDAQVKAVREALHAVCINAQPKDMPSKAGKTTMWIVDTEKLTHYARQQIQAYNDVIKLSGDSVS